MDGRRLGLMAAATAAVVIAAVALWWRVDHPSPEAGEESSTTTGHDGTREGARSDRSGSEQESATDRGAQGPETLALTPDGGPRQAGWVAPGLGQGADPGALPLTGAAMSAAWMPSMSPDDPAWDPRVEARQRFSSLEFEATTLQTDDPETFSKLMRDHADDVEAMTSRALDLRGAGHDESARHLEDEWARLQQQLVLEIAPQ